MADELGIRTNALREGPRKLDVRDGYCPGVNDEERSALRRLRRENRILREERNILNEGRGLLCGSTKTKPPKMSTIKPPLTARRPITPSPGCVAS